MIPRSTGGHSRVRPIAALLAVGALLLAASCGDDPTGGGSSVASVSLDPADATLVAGETLQLSAQPRDSRGGPLDELTISWTSEDPTVATVTAEGLVTAVAPGETEVRATVEGESASAAIRVLGGGIVGPQGATVTSADGAVSVTLPPGALATGTPISIVPAASVPAFPEGYSPASETAYIMGPDGTTFAQPVTVSIDIDENAAPGWIMPGDLTVLRWDGAAWHPLEDVEVDAATGRITGKTTGFSTFVVSAELPEITLTPNPASVNENQRSVILRASIVPRGDEVFDESFGIFRYRWSATTVNGSVSHDGASDPFGETTTASAVQYIATIPVIPEGQLDEVTVEVLWADFEGGGFRSLGTATAVIDGDLDVTVHLAPDDVMVPPGGSVVLQAVVQSASGPPPSFDRVQEWSATQFHGSTNPAPGTRTAQSSLTYTALPNPTSDPPRIDQVNVSVFRVDQVSNRVGWSPEDLGVTLVYTEVGSAQAFVEVGEPNYEVTFSPSNETIGPGESATFQVMVSPPPPSSFSYRYTSTNRQGTISPLPGIVSTSDNVTYTADAGSTGGTDVIEVEVLDGNLEPVGTASASVEVVPDEVETPAFFSIETYELGNSCHVRPAIEWEHVAGASSYRLEYKDNGTPRVTSGDHGPVTISVGGTVLREGDHFRVLAGFNSSAPPGQTPDCSAAVSSYQGRFTDARAFALFE